jgi:hypothetical protein
MSKGRERREVQGHVIPAIRRKNPKGCLTRSHGGTEKSEKPGWGFQVYANKALKSYLTQRTLRTQRKPISRIGGMRAYADKSLKNYLSQKR